MITSTLKTVVIPSTIRAHHMMNNITICYLRQNSCNILYRLEKYFHLQNFHTRVTTQIAKSDSENVLFRQYLRVRIRYILPVEWQKLDTEKYAFWEISCIITIWNYLASHFFNRISFIFHAAHWYYSILVS